MRFCSFLMFWAFGVAATAAPMKRDIYAPLRIYEVRVGIEPEWLVLEQLKLGSSFTHFLKLRRGQKTVALTVIPKAKFERWSQVISAMKNVDRGPACVHPFEAAIQLQNKRQVHRFCPNNKKDSNYVRMQKSSSEMIEFVRRHDALKSRK